MEKKPLVVLLMMSVVHRLSFSYRLFQYRQSVERPAVVDCRRLHRRRNGGRWMGREESLGFQLGLETRPLDTVTE